MRSEALWKIGAVLVVGGLVVPAIIFLPSQTPPRDNPWAAVATQTGHTDHRALMPGPYADGPSVTRACLECHEDAADQVAHTAHWTWTGDPVQLPGREEPIRIGKKNLINNFCIGVQSNWPSCTSCHAGYGWKDDTFDFEQTDHVDCLVCHDQSGIYTKTKAGLPNPDVDLALVAGSVGMPTRENCGSCHFKGGGGDAVKHGDLDGSLANPRARVDVHMGEHGLTCVDCHKTEDHVIRGRAMSVSVGGDNRVLCTDCHADDPHDNQRLNAHVSALACQSCHIPRMAIREATKAHWNWSEAGQDLPEDVHSYLKKKGTFVYVQNLAPEYYWFNGKTTRYLKGDKMDPLR